MYNDIHGVYFIIIISISVSIITISISIISIITVTRHGGLYYKHSK